MNVISIDFRGDAIQVLPWHGKKYVSVRSISEAIGIAPNSQISKIKSNPSFDSEVIIGKTDGGDQNIFCIPLSKLNGWLFAINPSKVKASIRDKVVSYQRECFDVLNAYFNGTETIVPKKLQDENRKLRNELHNKNSIISIKDSQLKEREGKVSELTMRVKALDAEIVNVKQNYDHPTRSGALEIELRNTKLELTETYRLINRADYNRTQLEKKIEQLELEKTAYQERLEQIAKAINPSLLNIKGLEVPKIESKQDTCDDDHYLVINNGKWSIKGKRDTTKPDVPESSKEYGVVKVNGKTGIVPLDDDGNPILDDIDPNKGKGRAIKQPMLGFNL